MPIPVAAQSKAWVCGRWLAEILGFESRQGHGCLSLANVLCGQVEFSVAGRSLVQKSPTSVVSYNNNPIHRH